MSNKTRHAKRRMVSAWKLRQGCSRCGTKDIEPSELHMDHLPGFPKLDNVSDLISQDYSAAVIWAEIDKCQVLCRPCHVIVTRERQEEEHETANGPALEALRQALGLADSEGRSESGERVPRAHGEAGSEAEEEVSGLKRLEALLEEALALVYELEASNG